MRVIIGIFGENQKIKIIGKITNSVSQGIKFIQSHHFFGPFWYFKGPFWKLWTFPLHKSCWKYVYIKNYFNFFKYAHHPLVWELIALLSDMSFIIDEIPYSGSLVKYKACSWGAKVVSKDYVNLNLGVSIACFVFDQWTRVWKLVNYCSPNLQRVQSITVLFQRIWTL